jgi:hypothetical protein
VGETIFGMILAVFAIAAVIAVVAAASLVIGGGFWLAGNVLGIEPSESGPNDAPTSCMYGRMAWDC